VGSPEAAIAALSAAGFPQVWTVSSDDHRDGAGTRRRREAERGRPLAEGAGLRCVLLTHLDGHELILVADRDQLPFGYLNALAAAAAESAAAAAESAAAATENAAPADMSVVADAGRLAAAILRQESVSVAVEADSYLVTASGTITPTPSAQPQLGVIFADASPDEYRPMLAPIHPINVVCHRASDGSVELSVCVDETVTDRAVADVMSAQLPRRRTAGEGPFVLDRSEIEEILAAGRGSDISVEFPDGIPAAFAAIAATAAGRTAVTGDGGSLTYAELDAASHAAASALVDRGVRLGERVGVCMERTPRAIVAMLAVLRAGGCYVPLDPTHPPARRAYMAEDAGLRLVITDADAVELPAGVTGVPLLDLSEPARTCPLPEVGPDDVAYVIYTSGTTGDPKGTVIPHGNVLALLAATAPDMDFGPSDVWTVFHSFAFDFSVWEIWGCLLTGGRLVVVPYWTARTPAVFARLLIDERVSVLSQTPSAFGNLIPAVLAEDAPIPLRMVIFGGEALRPAALVPWIRQVPLAACRLVNMYGITETTVHVTSHDITAADVLAGSRTVGRPLPGWSVSVRSLDGQVLPYGVAGEICVGGAGLAVGYLHRPGLTAERFPIDPGDGTRYYRSGDLGLLRPDGTVEHLGRIDDQVKVRGYRVELGEIRAALLGHSAVLDAVVTFRETDDGGAVYAFLVASGDISPTDLRRHLRTRVPDYMVPAVIRRFDTLPLTHNGKADVAALLALEDSAPVQEVPAVPGAGAGAMESLEAVVKEAWAGIFAPADIDENFFDLGGTSLQALKIAVALSGAGLGEVDPRDIYLNPSVKELVSLLETAHRAVTKSASRAIPSRTSCGDT
jgi:amino acid adenylation domain-containing protein